MGHQPHLDLLLNPEAIPAYDWASLPHRDADNNPLRPGWYELTVDFNNMKFREGEGYWGDEWFSCGDRFLVLPVQGLPGKPVEATYSALSQPQERRSFRKSPDKKSLVARRWQMSLALFRRTHHLQKQWDHAQQPLHYSTPEEVLLVLNRLLWEGSLTMQQLAQATRKVHEGLEQIFGQTVCDRGGEMGRQSDT